MIQDSTMKIIQEIMKISQINRFQILTWCGFLIASYIFYARVLLKRLPRELNTDLPFEIKIVFIYLFLLVFILFLLQI